MSQKNAARNRLRILVRCFILIPHAPNNERAKLVHYTDKVWVEKFPLLIGGCAVYKFKGFISFITITVISIAFLTQISLPQSRDWKEKRELQVFEQLPYSKLSNYNLVEVMIGLHLSSKLGRVEWHNAALLVELRIDPEKGRPEAWFQDVGRLIELSFVQLSNVKRILIRLIETEQAGGRLMTAVDVRSTDDWLAEEIAYLKYSDPVHEEMWRQRLRVSFTSVWEERYGPVTGYTSLPR